VTPAELCFPLMSQLRADHLSFPLMDGNHGRAVAWTAQQLGKKAVIYMPEKLDPVRLENIRSHGAEASITDLNYDDAVRLAWRMAQENGWIMVQDTAWEKLRSDPHVDHAGLRGLGG
ncbi:MAG: pyridoxal-phosphate dependent enzyme, partial [Bilophila sp.]